MHPHPAASHALAPDCIAGCASALAQGLHSMTLGLIAFPMLVLLAALGLIACGRSEPRIPGLLPAVRTVALITATTVYVAWLFTL